MSRTWHHRKWWKRYKDGTLPYNYYRTNGYEFYSGRPKTKKKASRGWLDPNSWVKRWTRRTERTWLKRELKENV